MSKAIEFLEHMGSDARLRGASEADLRDALEHAQLTPALREAILRADRSHLEALLSATANTCCALGVTANTCGIVACYEYDDERPDDGRQSGEVSG